ncbi:MAG: hypothetical protein ING89_17040 [Rubrivivax sp.]|nr:hypothetical protein [Rubrivivax sp.]
MRSSRFLCWRRVLGGGGVVFALLALPGCSTLPGAPTSAPAWADEAGCHAWLARLDDAVATAQVADAEAERIAGFAGLRVDRTGMALRDEARQSDAAFAAWVQRAAALDDAARAAEIANLPAAALGPAGAVEASARTHDCRHRAVQQLLAPSAQPLRAALLERATVPARYSTAGRALGLYPLVRWPFFAGVQGWQKQHAAEMARWATQPPRLHRVGPAAATRAREQPPPWPPATDALGLPQPTPAHAAQLFAWHAPVFEIEALGSPDRFGALAWPEAGPPRVDTAAPVVYQRLSHTRVGGLWLLQLSYTLWFPERPASSAFDLLAGALDGVVLRLTLDEHGQPLLLDTIHACGCYHLFFPAATLRPRDGGPRFEEWLFAPAPLPPLAPAQRLVVRLASATHYVMGLQTLPRATLAAETYTLQPEEALRSLPTPSGRRSLYGPDGLVAGTERGERVLFWPMGIASAGAMRQWGHHATAFVGQRHFDEADLIDRRFEPARP